MPLGLQLTLPQFVRSYAFVNDTMYVWCPALMSFKDGKVTEGDAEFLADALKRSLKFCTDAQTPIRKLILLCEFVEVDSATGAPLSRKLLICERLMRRQRKGAEPTSLAFAALDYGPAGPDALLMDATVVAAPTPDLGIGE